MTSSAISAEQREKQKITRCNLNFCQQQLNFPHYQHLNIPHLRIYIHSPRGGNFKKNYSVASASSAGSGLKKPAFFFSLIR
jgi:hypothetical protein